MSHRSKTFVSKKGKRMRWIAKDYFTKRRKARKAQRIARRKNRD